MAITEQEIEVREDIETDRERWTARETRAKTVLIYSGVVAAAAFIVVLIFIMFSINNLNATLKEVRESAAVSKQFYTEELIPESKGLIKKGNQFFDTLNSAAKTIDGAAQDVQTDYLPVLFNRLDGAGSNLIASIALVRKKTEQGIEQVMTRANQVGDDLHTNLTTLNNNQLKLGKSIEIANSDILPKVTEAADETVKFGRKLNVYVNDPAIAHAIKDGGATPGKINVVLDNTGSITGSVATFADRTLNPPKEKGVKGWLKKWIWTPLYTAGQLSGVLIRTIQN